jgi:hypothetical protein
MRVASPCRLILWVLVVTATGTELTAAGDGASGRRDTHRAEIIRVFKEARALNGRFQKTLSDRDRHNLEEYGINVLFPRLSECVQIVAAESDDALAVEFLKLQLAFRNAADEQFPSSLTDAYLKNPAVIERSMRHLTKAEQRFLYQQIIPHWQSHAGLLGIPEGQVADLSDRLARLKDRIDRE